MVDLIHLHLKLVDHIVLEELKVGVACRREACGEGEGREGPTASAEKMMGRNGRREQTYSLDPPLALPPPSASPPAPALPRSSARGIIRRTDGRGRTDPVLNVAALSREEVVHDVDDVALHHQHVDEVAADKAGAAGDQDFPLHGGRTRRREMEAEAAAAEKEVVGNTERKRLQRRRMSDYSERGLCSALDEDGVPYAAARSWRKLSIHLKFADETKQHGGLAAGARRRGPFKNSDLRRSPLRTCFAATRTGG